MKPALLPISPSIFNNKLDIIKTEFQPQFRKLGDHVAEEMAKMTVQLTEELSQAREQLTQARRAPRWIRSARSASRF